MLLPASANWLTRPVIPGFQAVTAPVVASSAANRKRLWPAMVLKNPLTYTMLPLITSVTILSSAPGFHALTALRIHGHDHQRFILRRLDQPFGHADR